MRDVIWMKTTGEKMIGVSVSYTKGTGAVMNAYLGRNSTGFVQVEFAVGGKSYRHKIADMARDNKKKIESFRMEALESLKKKSGPAWELVSQIAKDKSLELVGIDEE